MNIKMTALDVQAVRKVRSAGFVGLTFGYEPWLPTGDHIGRGRFDRLIALNLLKPNDDALPGIAGLAQSFVVSDLGEEAVVT